MYSLLGHLSSQTLKHLRANRAVSEVAELAEVAPEIWEQWENGEVPPPQNAAGILRGLGCSEDTFEQTYLAAAEAVRGFRRDAALQGTGIPEFEDLVAAVKSVSYCHSTVYDGLERIAKNPDLLQVLKLSRPTAADKTAAEALFAAEDEP